MVMDFRGREVTTIRDAMLVRFKVQDHSSEAFFWVTTLHRPLIIGKPWLRQHKAVVDFVDDSFRFNCDCPKEGPTDFVGTPSLAEEVIPTSGTEVPKY